MQIMVPLISFSVGIPWQLLRYNVASFDVKQMQSPLFPLAACVICLTLWGNHTVFQLPGLWAVNKRRRKNDAVLGHCFALKGWIGPGTRLIQLWMKFVAQDNKIHGPPEPVEWSFCCFSVYTKLQKSFRSGGDEMWRCLIMVRFFTT